MQHAGVQPDDPRPILSRPAPSDEAGFRQASHPHDSEEPFDASGVRFQDRGFRRGHLLPGGSRRHRTERGPEDRISRLIFCTGKVYYDLLEYRRKHEIGGAAIIRLEQIYPFHADKVSEIAARYPNATKWVWCQEEPLNMGAWTFVGRASRSSPNCASATPAATPPRVPRAARRRSTRRSNTAFSTRPSANDPRDARRLHRGPLPSRRFPTDLRHPFHSSEQRIRTMAHEIKIPSVGESIATATLGTWHKADGDYVRAGEVILTIETDKISTELESDRAGSCATSPPPAMSSRSERPSPASRRARPPRNRRLPPPSRPKPPPPRPRPLRLPPLPR